MSPINYEQPQDFHWTTTNIGEAIPGVQTPLSWTVWRPVGAALRDVGLASARWIGPSMRTATA